MSIQHEGQAPYAPAPAITTVLERARHGTLPSTVDAGVLERIGISESLTRRTTAALKLLDLIDDGGNPTPTFEKLRIANSGEYQSAVADWLRSVYGEILGIADPASATYEEVEDAFRGHTPAGQRTRMVTLFIGLCDYAGLLPEDSSLRGSIRSAKRGKIAVGRQKAQVRKKSPVTKREGAERPATTPPAHETRRMSKGEMLQELSKTPVVLHPFIQGLIETLPAVGSEWPPEKREKWLNAASATFDLMYELPSDEAAEVMS